VGGGVTDGRRSHDWSTSILCFRVCLLQVLSDISESWLNVEPWTCILWLLLGPGDACIFVFLQLSDYFLEWEWAQTLNSEDGYVVLTFLLPSSLKVIVDLARAEDNLSHLVLWKGLRVNILNQT